MNNGTQHEPVFSQGIDVVGCARCERSSFASGATREAQLEWLDQQPCAPKELCGEPGPRGFTCDLVKGHSGRHRKGLGDQGDPIK